MEETISRMAGSEHGSAKTVEELAEIGAGIGRPVGERTTTYERPTGLRPAPFYRDPPVSPATDR
jgi:FO synthase